MEDVSKVSNREPEDEDKPKKKRRAPTTKLSFNSQVTVVKYNKYNDKLLSPEQNDDSNAHSNLKVAKKAFKKRTTV